MPPTGTYRPRNWRILPDPINQWGGHPPLRLVLTGFPIAGGRTRAIGRPAWANSETSTPIETT